jgi:hypothetical protein
MIEEKVFAPNRSTSLQTTLAAEAHLEDGQLLLEERTLNKEKSAIYRTEPRRPTVSKKKKKRQYRAKVNVNKKQFPKAIS